MVNFQKRTPMIKKYFLYLNQKHYKAAALALLATASMSLSNTVAAQPTFAKALGVFPVCTGCHFTQDGGGDNLKPEAAAAFASGGLRPGLENFLKSLVTDTKPVLHPIDNQWNVQVGEAPLSIPLIVSDKEADKFIMQLSNASKATAPKGYSFSKPYTVSGLNLPAIDFKWAPKPAQKNRNYTAVFVAKETTGSKLSSNTVTANIFVWPPRTASAKNVISQLNIDSAKWNGKALVINGRIGFKSKVSAVAQKLALKTLRLNLKSNSGVIVGTPLTLRPNAKLAWTNTIVLPATQVPCLLKAEYEGLRTARTVKPVPKGCLK